MSDRATAIDHFLAGTRWENWARHRMTPDASTRSYMRLTSGDDSAILMDAPPETNALAPFITMTDWLAQIGLRPPRILHRDTASGFLLLSDLGDTQLAVAATQTDPAPLYQAAVDVLIHLHRQSPLDLSPMTPVVAGQMTDLFAIHSVCDPALVTPLANRVTALFETHAPAPQVVALRDYHAENLIWRPDRDGTDRVGLLDYQDAIIAPAGYDLVSLLRDARREIPDALVAQLTAHFADGIGRSVADLAPSLALLGVQRNLRILGIFARLAQQGRPQYLDHLPRVRRQLDRDLSHPALSEFSDWLRPHLAKEAA